jgi:hypothetical protein
MQLNRPVFNFSSSWTDVAMLYRLHLHSFLICKVLLFENSLIIQVEYDGNLCWVQFFFNVEGNYNLTGIKYVYKTYKNSLILSSPPKTSNSNICFTKHGVQLKYSYTHINAPPYA